MTVVTPVWLGAISRSILLLYSFMDTIGIYVTFAGIVYFNLFYG